MGSSSLTSWICLPACLKAEWRLGILPLRWVLACTFAGHGFVNLGFSPTIQLHQMLTGVANHWLSQLRLPLLPVMDFLHVLGWAELIVSILLILGGSLILFLLLPLLMGYLLTVGALAYSAYYLDQNSFLGLAEIMRRLPWFFSALTLWLWVRDQRLYPGFVRIGLAFAFLAHGTASLGLLGFYKGHIELALTFVPEEYVRDFVFATGISDTLIGLALLLGFPRLLVFVGVLWIVLVVFTSYIFAFPDGLFRTGFLIMALWVAFRADAWEHMNLFKRFYSSSPLSRK